jgi:hypothetical protein
MTGSYEYGLWQLVLFHVGIFMFFGLSFLRPARRREWRSLGAFAAFGGALHRDVWLSADDLSAHHLARRAIPGRRPLCPCQRQSVGESGSRWVGCGPVHDPGWPGDPAPTVSEGGSAWAVCPRIEPSLRSTLTPGCRCACWQPCRRRIGSASSVSIDSPPCRATGERRLLSRFLTAIAATLGPASGMRSVAGGTHTSG